jgi:hypothetical protein
MRPPQLRQVKAAPAARDNPQRIAQQPFGGGLQMHFDSSRIILALTLIGAGIVLLALRFFGDLADSLWPFFIIVPGILLLALGAGAGWGSRAIVVAGAIVAGVGIILLVQQMTDYFQSWAYAWSLLPAFAGAGLLVYGYREGDETAMANARLLMAWGGIGFVVLGVLFEALIFHESALAGGIVLPLLLIAGGAVMLVMRAGNRSGERNANGARPAAPPPDQAPPKR